MTTIKKVKPTRAYLEAKIREAEAQLASSYHFADTYLKQVEYPKLMASGVLIQMHFLGGKEAVTPVVIRGGLSPDTVAALRRDLARSYDESVEFQPSLSQWQRKGDK